MISDDVYELCLPILRDEALGDEDKTEKLEELLKKEASLNGKALENAVLDALWRHHESGSALPSTSPPPSRHNVIRKPSPAPWQLNRAPTPLGSSPRLVGPPLGFGIGPPGFNRTKSSTASPFTSPRPSPRLAFSSPHIPHSPSLSAYQFSEASTTPDIYADLSSDTVDWLVNDDAASTESSSLIGDGSLNAAAAEWVLPQTIDMSPYDMLRSILRDDKSDEELEKALEQNSYDLSATILSLMDSQAFDPQQGSASVVEPDRTYIVGKSMSPGMRPVTPLGQTKSSQLCKYWLQSGQCARADCRFNHDPTKILCKYFMMGNCLAGDTCVFSHDPSALLARMALEGSSTPPPQSNAPNFQVQDFETFPSLNSVSSQQWTNSIRAQLDPTAAEHFFRGGNGVTTPPPGLNAYVNFTPGSGGHPQSRPGSRHSRTATPSGISMNDDEAFPTLGSAATAKPGKRHHGKRGGHGHGHGHSNKDNVGPNTLAELVKMSPSPNPVQARKVAKAAKVANGSRENSAAAQAIPAPEHIPWLETGDAVNRAYIKARQEAFKHGGLRNRFLQSAAQAWNRNDSRAAKALSLRGQTENNLMREAHREAARHLYEERNKDRGPNARELYVDLHGQHPEEAVSYLEAILIRHQSDPLPARPIYAITGTGHHSKNGKDKVGKAVRGFLNEWRYAFREFSVPGDRNNIGGILGIDPSSWDRSLGERRAAGGGGGGGARVGAVGEDAHGVGRLVHDTRVRILKKEDLKPQAMPGLAIGEEDEKLGS